MKDIEVLDKSNRRFIEEVNYETGEINLLSYYDKDSLEGYSVSPPIDISSITSKGIYEGVIKEKLGRKRYRLWVSPILLDTVIDRQLSIKALSIFCYLGQRIGYNNMVYVNTEDMKKEVGYTRETVSLAITELLQSGLIKSPNDKLDRKGDRFFLMHPVYFFLGYYPMRDVLLRDWIKG